MTTVVPFAPTASQPFQFTATLDGQQYNVVVTWNLFGARWYLNIYTLAGALVLCAALTSGSPTDAPINLTWGYFFTSALVFLESANAFVITP